MTAPNALPAMVGPGGCLGTFPGMDLFPKWKFFFSPRQEKCRSSCQT